MAEGRFQPQLQGLFETGDDVISRYSDRGFIFVPYTLSICSHSNIMSAFSSVKNGSMWISAVRGLKAGTDITIHFLDPNFVQKVCQSSPVSEVNDIDGKWAFEVKNWGF
jgi:hypothetical protein